MALPIPPINPNNPIPNNPFFYPEQNYIQGEYSPFIVGSGLSLDNVTGVISASGVASSLAAGPGISLTTVGTTTTIGNLGLVGLTATSPINVTAGTTPDISVDAASTTQPGVVQLANTTTSSSVSQALTAAAGYSLQQQIDALVISNNLTLAGTIDGSTGNVATATAEGTANGFTVGSPLPTAASGNAEYFVIVTTAGTMTPPGGVATAVNQGDWWVSSGTSWTYYPVGFDPAYATTTAPGVVQLATNAEVQAGTESTHAVTSSALQSKLSDSVNLASSTCIASSNAVRTANNAAVAAQNDATSALSQVALAQADATQALADAAAAQFTANAAIPCACYTAKGDILGGTGTGTFSVLSPGTDGYMLYALSSATNGLQWAAPPADIPCAVITAAGDIVVGSGPATPTALPVGANGYILAANSACATGLEWVANSSGDVTSVTGKLPITVDNSNPQTPIVEIGLATTSALGVVSVGSNINVDVLGSISVNNASTTQSGVVQLNDTVASTSTTQAGTANAVKTAYDAAMNAVQSVTGTAPVQVDLTNPQNPDVSVDVATATTTGVVSVGSNIAVSVAGAISVANASTTQSGVVQLNDTTASTSTTQALTAAQGKNLQDQINALSITSNITLAGTLDTVTGNLVTVTTAGAGAGFAVGSPLPAAAAGNAEYFVIVTVPAASYTPPGGTATQTHVGDWFLSDGTVWDFLDVGFDPPYASTTVPGVVQLATNAQTQAGTDATLAVTAAGAAATYVPLADYATKGDILAATAASTPTALPVGTDGQILYACSTAASGLCWAAVPPSAGPATPIVNGIVYGCTEDPNNLHNTYLGKCAGLSTNTLDNCNTAVGFQAMQSVTDGGFNTGVGANALSSLQDAYDNTAVGVDSLCALTSGQGNVAVGEGTTTALTTGSCNVALGAYSLCSAVSDKWNVAIGAGALDSLNGGCLNIAIGTDAGGGLTTGCCNVIIGPDVNAPSNTGSGQLAIGYGVLACWLTGDSTLAIQPGAGIIDCAGSCGANGQVLMSNGSNAICWGAPAATPAATPTALGTVYGCTAADSLSAVRLGYCAGPSVTGIFNTYIGASSGRLATSAASNVAIGRNSLCGSASASSNVAIGVDSMLSASAGSQNVAIGRGTLGVATGSNNVVIGCGAGASLTSGSNNVLVGFCATAASATGSCQLAIGFSATDNWLTGTSTKAIKPGAGIIDCAGSCGTAGQILTSNGSNAIAWANSTAPKVYTANKALTSGTPIDLLSWSTGVRMGSLAVFATDNSTTVKWANITVGSASGIGSTAVITQSVGVGNFSIVAGGSGETIVRFTPSVTLASVDFVYQYNAAFGAQPSVL